MTLFQLIALLMTSLWLVLVVVRFRRSQIILLAGLFLIALFILVSLAYGKITSVQLGLERFGAWWLTLVWALGGLAVLLFYSRPADWLAGRWFARPPELQAFKAIQKSKVNLVAGILAAWLLGAFLEELIARGLVLRSLESWLNGGIMGPLAAGIAICIAGVGAGLMHFYQGARAVVIITQLSLLLGLLFALSGHNLWTVIICHGMYDTIAFIRFAARKSRYSV